MKAWIVQLFAVLVLMGQNVQAQNYSLDFCGTTFNFQADRSIDVPFSGPLSDEAIRAFYHQVNAGKHQPLINTLQDYREKYQLSDWIFYQLIRRTAQQISPKKENYNRYTLYKWFFLMKTGYDAKLALQNGKLLFYVWSDESLEDVPYFTLNGKQFVCLNIHDFAKIDLKREKLYPVSIQASGPIRAFSYKIGAMPDFNSESYTVKKLEFNYRQKLYNFEIKVNPELQSIFANYPVVEYGSYFNIPLSNPTYQSLITGLKKELKGKSQKRGIDYIMRFTRNAFSYQDDQQNFGKEKRLSPELTLLSDRSDCDDRAALFFYLVKEIYDLPMITLLYPTHITIAVQLEKPVGQSVTYQGKKYTICEPTPQGKDLSLGKVAADKRHLAYEVVYQYEPVRNN